MNRTLSYAGWAAVAVLGAFALGIIALQRGERHLVRLAQRHSESDGPPLAIGDHERLCPKAAT